MTPLDPQLVSFLVRLIHLMAMAVLVGGALLLWAVALTSASREREGSHPPFALMTGYEWLFWLALGLLVMTGVGNVGALGPALPPAESAWGTRFSFKLLAVVALALASLVRTAVVARVAASNRQIVSPSGWRIVKYGYGTTAVVGALVVTLAVSLRYG